jgi:hypothetical protein
MKKIIIFVLVLSLVSCKKAVKEVAEVGIENVAKVMAKETAQEETEVAAKKVTQEAVEGATEVVIKKTVKEVGEEGLEKVATQTVVKQITKEGSEKGFMASAKTALNRVMISSKNQFVKMDNYVKWLRENPDALLFGREKSGSILRENMKRVMGKDFDKFAGKTGFEAHHLVGVDSRFPSSEVSQNILKKYNIDINDPMNGILLPNNNSSLLKGTIHHGGHTKSYHDEIARRLQRATNRDECFQILDAIKDDLYKGRLSLYNELKNNTVINSFKR